MDLRELCPSNIHEHLRQPIGLWYQIYAINMTIQTPNLTRMQIRTCRALTIPEIKPYPAYTSRSEASSPNKTKRSIREPPVLIVLIECSYLLSYLLSSKLFAKHHRSSHASLPHEINHNAQVTPLAQDQPSLSKP